jgi:nucleotide-binding universal stress UspA family protein
MGDYGLEGFIMKKYENIIVPTDGSANSKRALEHAVVIASSVGAAITLVYVANIVSVISNFDQIPNASGYVTEQVALDMEEAGKSVLDEFAKAIPQDVAVKSVFEVGSPGPAILSVAKKYNADLIVMGSRGLGPLKGLFMGSVSSYIVSHSTCPALIVK